MTISTYLSQNFSVQTFGLFLALGFLLSVFVIWYEGKRDGFDEEKLFDLYLLSAVTSVLLSRFIYALRQNAGFSEVIVHALRIWTEGMNIHGAIIGFIVPIFLLVKTWKWSIYRILDIFSLAFLLGASMPALGIVAVKKDFKFLFVFAILLFAYAVFSAMRSASVSSRFYKVKARSGYVFSLTLIIFGIIHFFFLPRGGLIFYILLFTISVLNIYLRQRSLSSISNTGGGGTGVLGWERWKLRSKLLRGSMTNTILPKKLLDSLKGKLTAKRERLDKEEKLLDESDPYLQGGRDVGNAEEMDEAILEDAQRQLIDLKRSSISVMKQQVRRALAKIKIGTYGMCDVCGEPIESGRLEIYPEAATCASCEGRRSSGNSDE